MRFRLKAKAPLLLSLFILAALTSMISPVHAQDFTISVSPSSGTQRQGGASQFTVTVATSGTFPSFVSLHMTEDSGLNAVFIGPTNGTSAYTSTLLVKSNMTTPPGAYLVVVEGRGDGKVHGVAVVVTVEAASFTITIDPSSQTIKQGKNCTFTVDVARVNQFNGSVKLTARLEGSPTGLSAVIGPAEDIPPFTATLVVKSEPTVKKGAYIVTVRGEGKDPYLAGTEGVIVYEASATVVVEGANFTITITPSLQEIHRGQTALYNVTVRPVGGFNEPVTLTATAPEDLGWKGSIFPSTNIPPFNSTLRVYPKTAGDGELGSFIVVVQGTGAGQTVQNSTSLKVIETDFVVSIAPDDQGVRRGRAAEYTISVTSAADFNQAVNLSATGPSGMSFSFSKANGVPDFTSTLYVSTSSTLAPGDYVIVVKGKSGSFERSDIAMLHVGFADFFMYMEPTAASIKQGASASFTVYVNSTEHYDYSISLTATTPTGSDITPTLVPTSGYCNFTATMFLSTSFSTPTGSYIITVKGSGGDGVNHMTYITLNVGSSNFTISATPTTKTVNQSDSAKFTLQVGKTGSFNKPVTLSYENALEAVIGPYRGTPPFTATMIVYTSLTTKAREHLIIIQGESDDGQIVQTVVTLVVQRSDFNITISSETTLYQGQSTEHAITVSETGSFNEPVTLTVSAPSGITATISPTSGYPPFTATLKVETTLDTPAGTHTITVTGSGGGRTHTATLTIMVRESKFKISASPSSASIYQTQSASFSISVAQDPYFPSTVSLTVQAAGGNLTATLTPTSGTPSFTASLLVSTGEGTPAGTYVITIQGQSGSKTSSSSVSVTVNQKPPEYLVTVRTKGLTEGNTTVYVDGKNKNVELNDIIANMTFGPFDGLTSHTIKVQQEVLLDSVKFICADYSETVTEETTVTFTYVKYYKTTWKTEGLPSGKSVIMKIDGVSRTETSPVSFDLWKKAGAKVSFALVSPISIAVEGKGYTFVKWIDSSNASVVSPRTIERAEAFTAVYERAELAVKVYDVPKANVTMNGQNETVPAEGLVIFWLKKGNYTLTVTAQIEAAAGTVLTFKHYVIPKGGNTTNTANPMSITLTGDLEIEVVRKKQFLLTLKSEFGNPQGAGWYDENTTANFNVEEKIEVSAGAQYLCVGYIGDAQGNGCTGSVVMDAPKTITFQWRKQYLLTVNSQYGSPQGAGWYDENATAAFSVSAPDEAGTRYVFVSWTGDYSGSEPSGNVVMNAPKTVTANWRRLFETSITFLDSHQAPLSEPPSRILVKAPNGTQLALTQYASLWLDEGNWTLKQAVWHGVDVKQKEDAYIPQPKGVWKISLKAYALTAKVASSLTGSGLSGADVTLTLPDGKTLTQTTDSEGYARFAQVPAGTCSVTAEKDGSAASVAVALASDSEEQVKILPTLELLLYVGLPVAAVAAIASFLLYRKWRGRRTGTALPSTSEESSPPAPPPESDETSGGAEESLEDSLRRLKS